jgi:DtxR family Mn-dependent transcriptional regulator|tara:strand:- start:756 stop:1169 length:414 start_codon:yes stop_codon:yes gene_type:complete
MILSEKVEEYLEMLWIVAEKGNETAKINDIAKGLKIAPPSAVEMLRKMEKMGLVEYETRVGIKLTDIGRDAAKQVIRNHRIAELLLTEILDMRIDEEAVCGLEHHISEEIAEAICTRLNHPKKCPHDNKIPPGKCCG